MSLKHITFYFDVVSPYAWLAFEQLPDVLEGVSYSVEYRPVLLGALLQQQGNPGPAGIPPKRDWTYRHVSWLGQHLGVPLAMPARHPFNPLPLLRQALACSADGSVNRFAPRLDGRPRRAGRGAARCAGSRTGAAATRWAGQRRAQGAAARQHRCGGRARCIWCTGF